VRARVRRENGSTSNERWVTGAGKGEGAGESKSEGEGTNEGTGDGDRQQKMNDSDGRGQKSTGKGEGAGASEDEGASEDGGVGASEDEGADEGAGNGKGRGRRQWLKAISEIARNGNKRQVKGADKGARARVGMRVTARAQVQTRAIVMGGRHGRRQEDTGVGGSEGEGTGVYRRGRGLDKVRGKMRRRR
jgi:hypothetical protein